MQHVSHFCEAPILSIKIKYKGQAQKKRRYHDQRHSNHPTISFLEVSVPCFCDSVSWYVPFEYSNNNS